MDKFLGYQMGVGFGVDGGEEGGGSGFVRSKAYTNDGKEEEIPLSPPREERGNIN